MKRYKAVFILALTLAFTPVAVIAGIPDPLVHTYRLAYSHAPDIDIAKARVDFDKASLSAARSEYFPSVQLESGMTKNLGNDSILSNADNEQISMAIYQPLLSLSSIAAIKEKNRQLSQGKLNQNRVNQQLMLQSATLVFDLLRADASASVAQKQVEALQNHYDRAELAFKLGASKLTDKLDALARLDLSRAAWLEQQSVLQQKEFDYFLLTGQEKPEISQLNTKAEFSIYDNLEFEHWYEQARVNNLLLQQSELEISRQSLIVIQEKNKQWPRIEAALRSDYSLNEQSNDASISLSAIWPIYNRASNSGKIAQLRANKVAAKAQLRLQDQLVRQTIKADLVSIQTGKQKLSALQQAIRSSQSALEATREGIRLGLRSTPELLDAEQQFFSTQFSYVSARFDYLTALLRLKFNSGILTEADLAATDALFAQ